VIALEDAAHESAIGSGGGFFYWNSGSRFLRSASVGLPSPVQTKHRAPARHAFGMAAGRERAFKAPEEMP